jgi:hypothetical protein
MTSTQLLWMGRILSGLVVAFLAFDAVNKIIMIAPVIEATQKLFDVPAQKTLRLLWASY